MDPNDSARHSRVHRTRDVWHKRYHTQVDLWAVGLTLFWLLFDRLPWGPPHTPRFPGAGAERYPDLMTQILREPIVPNA